MDDLNLWFDRFVSTPIGSILLFLAVFLSRIVLDRWQRKQERKAARAARKKAHG